MIAPFLACRYGVASQGRPFARLLTLVAIGSVGLSVFATTVTLGALTGFRAHLATKFHGLSPHLTIWPGTAVAPRRALEARLRDSGPAVRWYRVVEGEVVIQSVGREGYADLGVQVRGIDPPLLREWRAAQFFFTSQLRARGTERAASAALRVEAAGAGVIVGSEILMTLGIHPEVADRIRLTAPLGRVDPTGELRPQARTYEVRGFFRSGIYQSDSKLVLLERSEAERLLGLQGRESWSVYVEDEARLPALAAQLRTAGGSGVRIETWAEQNRRLFGALRFEQAVMTLLLLVMLGIAGVSIRGVVTMQVWTRRRDLALLVALGASRAQLRRVVMAMAARIGLMGACGGLAGAAGLIWWVRRHPIPLPESFYLETLPVECPPALAVGVALLGVGLALLAAWYPARQASRQVPAVGLRSE